MAEPKVWRYFEVVLSLSVPETSDIRTADVRRTLRARLAVIEEDPAIELVPDDLIVKRAKLTTVREVAK